MLRGASVLVQGVAVALDVPVVELLPSLSHPDNFLYVVVRPRL